MKIYKTNLKEVNKRIKEADFVVAREDEDKIVIFCKVKNNRKRKKSY